MDCTKEGKDKLLGRLGRLQVGLLWVLLYSSGYYLSWVLSRKPPISVDIGYHILLSPHDRKFPILLLDTVIVARLLLCR